MNRTERLQATERVRVRLTSELAAYGFKRGKTSWWYRMRSHEAELVHVLLRQGQAAFRVQGAIRVLNDPSPTVDLNGPLSGMGDAEYLGFAAGGASIAECASECAAFTARALLPWFAAWTSGSILRNDEAPFSDRTKDALLDALAGRGDSDRVNRSKGLFGAPRGDGPRLLG